MNMPELGGGPQEEIVTQESFFRLGHVSNAQIKNALEVFTQEGMQGPYAALPLLSLFEPLPAGGEIEGYVISDKVNGMTPKTLWDQIGPAFAKFTSLSPEQQDNLRVFQYYALDAIANESLVRKFHGKEYGVNEITQQKAREIKNQYEKQLQKIFDPDSPQFDQLKKTVGVVSKQAVTTGMALISILVLTGCAVKAGTGEIPTQTPRVVDLDIPITNEEALNVIAAIEDQWGAAIKNDGFTIEKVTPSMISEDTLAIMEEENGLRITLAAVLLNNEDQLLFLVDVDKNKAYYLYPDVESYIKGKKIVYDALQVDQNNNITAGGFQIIAQKEGAAWVFSLLEEGESTPTPFAPTEQAQFADFVEVVFNANPVKIPSVDLTPTAPAEDPMAGAPEGATGKDNDGNWIKEVTTEKGNTLTYTWDAERESFYRPIFSGYLWDQAKEINDQDTIYKQDELFTNAYVDSSIAGEMLLPTLTHEDNTDLASAKNFTALFQTHMNKALQKREIIKAASDFNMLKWVNHELYLDFINSDGPQRWGLWTGSEINVHIRGDYDELKENMTTNGFAEVKGKDKYGPPIQYMVKIWADKDGNFYWDIAPSSTTWTEKQFLEMLFFGWAAVFSDTNVTNPVSGSELSTFVLSHDAYPFFTFEPPK